VLLAGLDHENIANILGCEDIFMDISSLTMLRRDTAEGEYIRYLFVPCDASGTGWESYALV
jgi:hypothetical protein